MSEEIKKDGELPEEPNDTEPCAAPEQIKEAPKGSEIPPQKPPKRKKQVSLSTFLITCVALVLAAVLVTFACCANIYKQNLANAKTMQVKYFPFELLNQYVDLYSLEDTDEKVMFETALKAYIAATGDVYAAYYTEEEYEQLLQASAGDSVGVGINVINDVFAHEGVTYLVFHVINVGEGSPAEKAGLKVGDRIYSVGVGAEAKMITELGYDVALTQLKGAEGTEAKFSVFRMKGEGYESLDFSVTRAKVTTTSVYSHRSAQDPKVGIIKIVQFDLTTPAQFSKAMDSLKGQGCDKFVFDVRYNPGGDLRSIEAVLSYFLEEGDVLIRTVDSQEKWETSTVKAVTYKGSYADCSVSKDDIGKYRGVKAVVLCNESTASAAELFAATFRDYEIGTLVGTTTYGKGSMQTTFPLAPYYSGALKLTTAKYYPAKGDNYHGVGITPHVTEPLSEEAAKKNVYLLTDEEDNQLQKALEQFGTQK